MLLSNSDCDDCAPTHFRHSFSLAGAASILPFLLTFIAISYAVHSRLYPALATPEHSTASKFTHGSDGGTQSKARSARLKKYITSSLPEIAFSVTLALSAVLIELLLCEISDAFNPATRRIAIQFTVTSLMLLLVVAIPLIEIHLVLKSSGLKYVDKNKSRARLAWTLDIAAYLLFLVCFWTIGQLLPSNSTSQTIKKGLGSHNVVQAGLERLGVAGISSMALLSGFASVSSILHSFVLKTRPVAQADIARKRAGLDATNEMLREKSAKLNRLEQKMSAGPAPGFWTRTIGSIRGNADIQERQTLGMEVSGLETMSKSLESSLSMLEARQTAQVRSQTRIGRLAIACSHAFSCYCIYRICTTTVNIARRFISREAAPGDSDPVTNTIAIFARHIYPSLDQASWARQISFLLSGVMLLASFSAVMQTFHLIARFVPQLFQATKSNFALIVAQISGMYVISSALMLRGMMPKEVGSVINDALGVGVLEPVWASKWFDGFFIVAVLLTAQGIWVGRKIGGSGAWDDDSWDMDIEMGKRL